MRVERLDPSNPLSGLLEQLMSTFENGPEEKWQRARITGLELDGARIFKENFPLDRDVFVNMSCKHDGVASDMERRKAVMVTLAHTWLGDQFEDVPLELMEISDEEVNRIQCPVCQSQQFVSGDQILEMNKRKRMPGSRKSSEMCGDCWEICEPMAGNETLILLANQYVEHVRICRLCRRGAYTAFKCPEARRLMELTDSVQLLNGERMKDVAKRVADRSKAFKEEVNEQVLRASGMPQGLIDMLRSL